MTGRSDCRARCDVEYLDSLAADLRGGLDYAWTTEDGVSLDFGEGIGRILAVAGRLRQLTLDGSLPDDRRLTVVRDELDAVDTALRKARAAFEDGEDACADRIVRCGAFAAVDRAIAYLRGTPVSAASHDDAGEGQEGRVLPRGDG